jgi:NADP-dependent 3-hydroxy acid dehydrogenase YdfG
MTETQRVAIVTGAAGGIGRAMTLGLLAAGIRVAGVDRDREPLEALAASAREQGKATELLTIQTDLTGDSAAGEITKATRDRFGRIDILVNNAGIGPGSIRPDSWQRPLKFWEITPDQWRRFVAVHTTAPLTLANAVVPEMMRQGWGRIVNVTTSLGTMLNAGSPTYGPSKAALEAQRDHGEGPRRDRRDRQRFGSGRDHQHSHGVRPSGLRSRQDDPARSHGVAACLAGLRCRRESDGSSFSRRALGYQAVPGTSGREGWSTGRLDQHCHNANRAEPLLAPPGPSFRNTWESITKA